MQDVSICDEIDHCTTLGLCSTCRTIPCLRTPLFYIRRMNIIVCDAIKVYKQFTAFVGLHGSWRILLCMGELCDNECTGGTQDEQTNYYVRIVGTHALGVVPSILIMYHTQLQMRPMFCWRFQGPCSSPWHEYFSCFRFKLVFTED